MNAKKLFLIIFIVLFLILSAGFVFWNKQTSKPAINISGSQQNSENVIGEESTTTTSFLGYYLTNNSVAGKPKECSIFVIPKSSDPLFDFFSEMVQQGNTVNSIDSKGDLFLNVDLANVSTVDKARVVSSTESNPIILDVQKKRMEGKDAGPCTSFVDILSVEVPS
ncbi:MAG TPA: hypothetical protein VHF05_00750 [Candidatus Paceibacterota bacterium]|jgi:hypothetical protein|nr:hypothetical protein [Candidatus Paceibacterota bacterium]